MVRNSTRKFKKLRGGFFPSIMGGLLTNGPIFFAPAFAQGVRLLRNNTARMKSRGKSRGKIIRGKITREKFTREKFTRGKFTRVKSRKNSKKV